MTSGEGGNTEQNEYEESFKRFKTLFIVGTACFCLGVTVVIFGNRFQLYEVQRLGIIFSSFGIGWIVLAIAYLIYMKWCFVPGESENSVPQTVQRVGSMTSRTLIGRPPSSSKMFEIPRSTEERGMVGHTSMGKSYATSSSLVQNVARLPSSENDLRKPLHSSRKFERRSYSVRNFKGPSNSEKNCKRLTTSFKDCERPLSSRKSFEKRMALVNNMKMPLSSKGNFERLPPESQSSTATASFERHFGRQSPSERSQKMLSSTINYEKPSTELRNFDRQLSLVKNIDKHSTGNCMVSLPPAENFGRLSSPDKDSDSSPLYKTDLKTKHEDSSPPCYYEVVLSMPRSNNL